MMDLRKTATGRWELRWREGTRRRSRTFDRKGDAETFEHDRRRRKQLGQAHVVDDIPLAEFVLDYWRLHAIPNLAPATRDLYRRTLENHIAPRLGDYGLRELDAPRLARFRADLERAGLGAATVVKAMTVVQSILSFAVAEKRVEYNAAKAVRKPAYERAREPHIFTPADVEQIRAKLEPGHAVLVSILAYAGPRPEEALRLEWRDVGDVALRFRDTKRRRNRHTPLLAPLADDLRLEFMRQGRPGPRTPIIRAHDGGPWQADDWRNFRRRVWQGEPERPRRDRKRATPPRPGVAPPGTRPRDLRSSYVTLRVYEGIPLTTVAAEVGTSVAMLDRHYAGVIANWDGRRVPADEQIRATRGTVRSATG